MKKMFICASLMLSAPVMAQMKDWKLGAVLDVAYTSKELGLGQRQSGLALGHSDVMAQGPLGDYFSAQRPALLLRIALPRKIFRLGRAIATAVYVWFTAHHTGVVTT